MNLKRHPWLLLGVVGLAGLIAVMAAGGRLFPSALGTGAPASVSAPDTVARDSLACVGYVDVHGGVAALSPSHPGVVEQISVRQGDEVAHGTVLIRLDDRLARLRVAEAQAGLEAARSQLDQARLLVEQRRLRIAQQQALVEASGRRQAAARLLVTRKQELLRDRLITASEAAIADEQVKEQEALYKAESDRLAELKLQDPALDVRRAEAEVAVLTARLQQAEDARERCFLKAPGKGTVLRVLVHPGELIGGQPNAPAVLFCPAGPYVIRAEVEQEFAGRLAVGLPARATDETNAALAWQGRVQSVAGWYAQRRSNAHDPYQLRDARTVECEIGIDPNQPPMRIGQRVRVVIGPMPR